MLVLVYLALAARLLKSDRSPKPFEISRQTPLLSSVPQTPMPPATQRTVRDPRPLNHNASPTNGTSNPDLFTDPMMGAPLSFYIDKDVQDKDRVVQVITNHGGVVSPSYSAVPYILVDPYKESGQALYRQYVGRKGKLVLDARWVYECVKHGQLQTFKANWAGCKLDGTEKVGAQPVEEQNSPIRRGARSVPSQPQEPQPAALPPTAYVSHPYSYPPPHPAPWHDASGIPPQATHIQHVMPPQAPAPRHPNPMWQAQPPHYAPLDATTGASDYPDYTRYRPEQDWTQAPAPGEYYPEEFAPYNHSEGGYLGIDDPTVSGAQQPNPPQTVPSADAVPSQPRGRKRTRSTAHGPVNPSALVPPKGPPARSPTPPTRVLKSTYGGNLYTADDVEYLKKYIDYCQDQGLVLSLREICERIAVKAPHHTFYSWRRYCNKHQIRLGSYQMENNDRSPSPGPNAGADDEGILEAGPSGPSSTFPPSLSQTHPVARDRSPTPPKALTRSTTGKGIAFTNEDVTFLVRFLEHRKSKEGDVDMVQFWKDVADRAPHHSRASWMKYWRRHKHELEPDETGQPPAPLPEKKLRYSSGDDILLARYFATRPQGTSDQIFQAFAKQHPHHPWKGWQEHHRIHKKTVDHYVEMIQNGQPVEPPQDE